jgi:capsid assembly protease
MYPYQHLELIGKPLLADAARAGIFIRSLAAGVPSRRDAGDADPDFDILAGAIAVVKAHGFLTKRSAPWDRLNGFTGYDTLSEQIQKAANDPQIAGILLDCDSFGGECGGMRDVADLIYSLRGKKLVVASINDLALCAGCAIASAAARVFITREGNAGSIGCAALHLDQSAADARLGLRFTYVHAGRFKVDGNAHEPLSESARSDIQAEVDYAAGQLTDLMARLRGVSAAAIMDTEARTFFGPNACPLFADAVGNFEDAMSSMIFELGLGSDVQRGRLRLDRARIGKLSAAPLKQLPAGPQTVAGAQKRLDALRRL